MNNSNNSSMKMRVPGAKQAIDKMKYEIANEFGVNLGPDATSRANGSVGGEITRRLVQNGLNQVSGTTKGGDYQNGKAVYEAQAGPPCKVLHPRIHPLPHLRPAPLCAAQVRHLPCMLPRAGLQGRDPGRQEGFLVTDRAP